MLLEVSVEFRYGPDFEDIETEEDLSHLEDLMNFFGDSVPHILVRTDFCMNISDNGRLYYRFVFSDVFEGKVLENFPRIEIYDSEIVDLIDEFGPKNPQYYRKYRFNWKTVLVGRSHWAFYSLQLYGDMLNQQISEGELVDSPIKILDLKPETLNFDHWDSWPNYADYAAAKPIPVGH